jgi:hypothetical protein
MPPDARLRGLRRLFESGQERIFRFLGWAERAKAGGEREKQDEPQDTFWHVEHLIRVAMKLPETLARAPGEPWILAPDSITVNFGLP